MKKLHMMIALAATIAIVFCGVLSACKPETPSPEPVDTNPATQPQETDPTDTEPADTDPVDTDPADTDPADTEPTDTDPVETDPVETDPVDPPADIGLEYEMGDDGYYVITGIGTYELDEVVVPSTVNGIQIKAIADEAFMNCDLIKSITIHDGIEVIGKSAFEDCDNLQKVVLPATLVSIEDRAFASAFSVNELTIPESVTHIGEGVFGGCAYILEKVNNVFYVGNWAFSAIIEQGSDLTFREGTIGIADRLAWYAKPKSVTIPEGVKYIGSEAFADSPAATISLPSTLVIIGESAFANCAGLPSELDLSSITELGAAAFVGGATVQKITLGPDIANIPNTTFAKTHNLKEVVIMSGDSALTGAFKYSQSAGINFVYP